MITDSIKNIGPYLPDKYRDQILKWIGNVRKDLPEGKYEIAGEDVFARVLSYHTKEEENCRIEAHNRYVDIQSTIIGEEGIQVYHRERLKTGEDYDSEKDVVFFQRSCEHFAKLVIKEEEFAMLFSYEAHQPEISYSGECPKIKKFVIKIKEELFNE